MASIVLSSVGSSLGNYVLPGLGGRLLGAVGRQAGRYLDSEIGLSASSGAKDGPRLESLKVQDSRYGIGIPVTIGRVRVAGNVIWVSDLIETSHENQTSGGKGGITEGVFGNSRTTYTYSIHCAIAIGAGVVGSIDTIWADSKIIYQNGVWKDGVVSGSTFYAGTTLQEPDPLMQSLLGSDQVPAYRGVAYIVFESLQLSNFSNRLPNLTIEVSPPVSDAQPEWLGYVDAATQHLPGSLRNKGMPPLAVESGGLGARRMIIGGFTCPDTTAAFDVIEYEVIGNKPVEIARTQSVSFSVSDVTDHAWAMAPDKRFIALYMQVVGSSPTHRLVIYDSDAHQFGNVYSVNLSFCADNKQIAWIDAQHFVLTDISDGKRGLRVFARAGMNIVDLGFFDVWGVNTATTRVPLFYAQFTPMAGGLLHYMVDVSPYFTSIYTRSLVWQGNTLVVGDQYTLTSGYDPGSGSGAQACLLKTGEGEWTLYFATVLDMQLMSFRPGLTSTAIIRPWQRLTNSAFGLSLTSHPVVYGNRICVVQRSSSDNNYRLSEIALNDNDFSLVVDGAIVNGFEYADANFGAASIDSARLLLMGIDGFENNLSQLAIIRRRNTGGTLDDIVASILTRAGYANDDYDVTDLASIPVDGYVVDDPMPAASALQPLQFFEPFDLIESDAKLKAIRRRHEATVSIPLSESRASNKNEDSPSLTQTRTQELDLPLEVTVDYLDASRDYEVGSQRARRSAARGARTMAKINLPIVCSAAKAKQVAEERLYSAWAEREQLNVCWSRRWLAVEPGDVVDIDGKLLRLMHIRQVGGVLDIEGALVAPPIASAAQADEGYIADHKNIVPVESKLYLMDLPLLRSADDQPGVYAAVSGIAGWPGASLWRASDSVNYSSLSSFGFAATAGLASTVLADRPSWYMDRNSTINVQLMQGILSSCAEADLLNGANAALLGNEIIQFQTATLIGPGLYALSNLLRGRRGTEDVTSAHAVGERFILLTAGTVQFIPALLSDLNRAYYFRALSNGQSLGDVMDESFAYGLITLRPFAPVHITGNRSSGTGSDLTISWKRRARLNGDWVDNVDVPLDEPAELYDLEIMNGSAVMRTFSGLTTSAQNYSASQQSADWGGSIPSTFTVNVYQLSSRYGRGQKATAVI